MAVSGHRFALFASRPGIPSLRLLNRAKLAPQFCESCECLSRTLNSATSSGCACSGCASATA
ncbi:hypothetical protein BRM54_11380, partial [Xanthomonas oryzae pv. oryzae]